MVRTKTRYFHYHEIFQCKLPFYKLIEMYFDRSKPYTVELVDFIGAQVYMVTQEQ